MENQRQYSAKAIAKERLENCLTEKAGLLADDLSAWKFYTYLIKQAEKYQIDYSEFTPPEYQRDHAQAVENCKRDFPERF